MTDLQLLACKKLAKGMRVSQETGRHLVANGGCRAMIETGFQVVVQHAKLLGGVYLHLARKQLA